MSRLKLLHGVLTLASSIWSGELTIHREVPKTQGRPVATQVAPEHVPAEQPAE